VDIIYKLNESKRCAIPRQHSAGIHFKSQKRDYFRIFGQVGVTLTMANALIDHKIYQTGRVSRSLIL
jgi:hypothetical protein